ncbi:hypothetical protein IC006_2301 [Sulfuracidifex tepidarius]|uniref:Uncharacterized protein n=1 Tax=Sulfuracidifex tepidarius TaxID=1294262 RepID=A0A510DXN5_9CREN|nr:hypothetical protein IC006_2301 [Sulfuracidifex tepidarius]BBG27752.1 hypothetical protein IC007_2306 [Sulfuracidifex tepidarius]
MGRGSFALKIQKVRHSLPVEIPSSEIRKLYKIDSFENT